jgi:hypothetical protein
VLDPQKRLLAAQAVNSMEADLPSQILLKKSAGNPHE